MQFAIIAAPGIGGMLLDRRRRRQSVATQVHNTLMLCTVDMSRVPPEVIEAGIAAIESRRPGDFSASDLVDAGRSLIRLLARPQVVRRAFEQVTAPVLMLHGDQDRLEPINLAVATARAFPAWRFEVAKDIGHVPMLEAPDWTTRLVLDWLEHDAKLLRA